MKVQKSKNLLNDVTFRSALNSAVAKVTNKKNVFVEFTFVDEAYPEKDVLHIGCSLFDTSNETMREIETFFKHYFEAEDLNITSNYIVNRKYETVNGAIINSEKIDENLYRFENSYLLMCNPDGYYCPLTFLTKERALELYQSDNCHRRKPLDVITNIENCPFEWYKETNAKVSLTKYNKEKMLLTIPDPFNDHSTYEIYFDEETKMPVLLRIVVTSDINEDVAGNDYLFDYELNNPKCSHRFDETSEKL